MNKQNKVKKSLVSAFFESIFASCYSGFTADYITPYALVLKATTRAIGFLSAFPFLASSIAQLKSADIAERMKSRKKPINIFVLIHTLLLVPVILIPYLFKIQPVIFLIIFVTLSVGFNAFTGPIYSGLLSEYIPYKMRGRYFGWRNKIMLIVIISVSLIAGLILQYFRHSVLKGFLIIFCLALVCRFISWYFLTRLHEPVFRFDKDSYFSFSDFVKNFKNSNFGKFVLFVSGMQFCVNLAGPFFPVFMLRDLKFNYIIYTIVVTTVTAIQIFTIGRWGRCADWVGNIRVLKFTSLIIASLPLWWIINQNPAYLVFAQLLSGFAWAGFNLCTANFIYDAVTPSKRIRCFGYFNVFVGLAVFLGAGIGGYLANSLPNIFGYKILTLFFISSALRFLVVFLLSPKIKEVRATEHMAITDLTLCVIGLKPTPK
jgi:MFS family permease